MNYQQFLECDIMETLPHDIIFSNSTLNKMFGGRGYRINHLGHVVMEESKTVEIGKDWEFYIEYQDKNQIVFYSHDWYFLFFKSYVPGWGIWFNTARKKNQKIIKSKPYKIKHDIVQKIAERQGLV